MITKEKVRHFPPFTYFIPSMPQLPFFFFFFFFLWGSFCLFFICLFLFIHIAHIVNWEAIVYYSLCSLGFI